MADQAVGRRSILQWQQARVLALLVVAGLLLVYGIYRVGAVFDVFASRYEITTLVPSALGLREGAQVTLAGQRIGQVKRIEHIPVAEKRGDAHLRIIIAIAEEVKDQIRRDSRAFLRTQGLMGDKFIDIMPGTSGFAILQPGDTIIAGESLDLDQFMMQASGALERATGIVENLQEITGGITRGEGTMGQLLHDEQLYVSLTATTTELQRTLAELNRADGTFGRLLRDPALYQRLNGAVARVDSIGAMVLSSNGTLGRLLREDTVYRSVIGMLGRADSAVAGISGMVDRMTTGEGSMQKMLTDPRLYDELLRAITDVQTLLNDIRLNPAKYKPAIRVDVF